MIEDTRRNAKLMVAFPLYKSIPAPVFVRWLGMEKDDVVGTITTEGVYLPDAMGQIVEHAMSNNEWDRLVIMEADMLPPIEALKRVAMYPHELHVVGSMYFQHKPPHLPMAYIQEDNIFGPLSPDTVGDWCEHPGVYQVDAVGFGFTSISRQVLQAWPDDLSMFHSVAKTDTKFPWTGDWKDDPNRPLGSHDLWFCRQAKKAGYNIFVDTAVQCGHLSETVTGLSDNQSYSLPAEAELIEFNR